MLKLTTSTTALEIDFRTGSIVLGHWEAQSSARLASSSSQTISLMLVAAGMPSPLRDPLAICRRYLTFRSLIEGLSKSVSKTYSLIFSTNVTLMTYFRPLSRMLQPGLGEE